MKRDRGSKSETGIRFPLQTRKFGAALSMADSDNDSSPAMIAGSRLAGELVASLDATPLQPRERMLVWVGLFAAFRVSCEQQLGRERSEDAFRRVEAAVRTERAKLQH
jgi:hypothetical protein